LKNKDLNYKIRIDMKVVILAVSKKLSGYCVAGKEIRDDGSVGPWVRPITRHREHGVVWLNDMKYPDGSLPQLLDIAEIPLEEGVGAGPVYQTENRWCPSQPRWTRLDKIDRTDVRKIASFEDRPANLWLTPSNLRSDRIPFEYASTKLKSSLLFVRAENLNVSKETDFGGQNDALRVSFGYGGGRYCLKWTVKSRLKAEAIRMFGATDQITSHPHTWVCISLGEPFGGQVYRLAAAVIGPGFPV